MRRTGGATMWVFIFGPMDSDTPLGSRFSGDWARPRSGCIRVSEPSAGIRSFKRAQVQYHRSLDRYYAQLTRHGGRASEHDLEHDDFISSNWHAGLVSPPEDVLRECSLRLTRGEANISPSVSA